MNVEVGMVSAANTVVDPWAVMVVPLDTPIADVAVATLRQADHSTEWTKALGIERLHQAD